MPSPQDTLRMYESIVLEQKITIQSLQRQVNSLEMRFQIPLTDFGNRATSLLGSSEAISSRNSAINFNAAGGSSAPEDTPTTIKAAKNLDDSSDSIDRPLNNGLSTYADQEWHRNVLPSTNHLSKSTDLLHEPASALDFAATIQNGMSLPNMIANGTKEPMKVIISKLFTSRKDMVVPQSPSNDVCLFPDEFSLSVKNVAIVNYSGIDLRLLILQIFDTKAGKVAFLVEKKDLTVVEWLHAIRYLANGGDVPDIMALSNLADIQGALDGYFAIIFKVVNYENKEALSFLTTDIVGDKTLVRICNLEQFSTMRVPVQEEQNHQELETEILLLRCNKRIIVRCRFRNYYLI